MGRLQSIYEGTRCIKVTCFTRLFQNNSSLVQEFFGTHTTIRPTA